MPVDPRAVTGFSATAPVYDRVRPTYPLAAVAAAARALGVTPAATLLDLAAGTGKLTRLLVDVADEVIAVDPSAGMLDVLRASVPGVRTLIGEAEAIPLPDDCAAAVFVGEAFHWFDVERAGHEIARVLVPGGGLCLLWNRLRTDQADTDPRVRTVRDLIAPYRIAAGEFPAGDHRWAPRLAATGCFSAPQRTDVVHEQRLSADELVALASTWSWVANLPAIERASLLEQAAALVGSEPVTLTYDLEIFLLTAL